jgi:putative aminopeptidase FrvX
MQSLSVEDMRRIVSSSRLFLLVDSTYGGSSALGGDLLCAAALDNRAGVYVGCEVLRRLERPLIGSGLSRQQRSGRNRRCRLGAGPCISHGPNTNPGVEELLKASARRRNIPFQKAPSGELEGNDAKAIQTVAG